MRLFNLPSILFTALISTSLALPGSPHPRSSHLTHSFSIAEAKEAFEIYDFLILDVSHSSSYSTQTQTQTLSLSFTFTDLNSNTSTLCNSTWQRSNTTDTTPYGPSYLRCNPTSTTTEFFAWHMNTYTSANMFSISLAHAFQDPTHFPPPYSEVEYFSRSTNISLACHDAMGTNQCLLPASGSPLHAIVDSISN